MDTAVEFAAVPLITSLLVLEPSPKLYSMPLCSKPHTSTRRGLLQNLRIRSCAIDAQACRAISDGAPNATGCGSAHAAQLRKVVVKGAREREDEIEKLW